MHRSLFVLVCFLLASCAPQDASDRPSVPTDALSSAAPADNVILITLDGLRWEELFTGADPWLLNNERYTRDMENVRARFWRDTPEARREALMPFFWSVIAEEGTLWGNRLKGSHADVTNQRVFSYP
ncbi:MAG: phosphoglyceromutase, partial [Alphaproteobacteria bacterium]|nr:phosphoglyceromutase [Alphaproteobacteria bacterium]